MVVLIDTNVSIDFLIIRQPFYHDAKTILQACTRDDIQGYIACAIFSISFAKAILMKTGELCWKNYALFSK